MFGSKNVVRKNNDNLLKTSGSLKKMDTSSFSKKIVQREHQQLNNYNDIKYDATTMESNSDTSSDIIDSSSSKKRTTTKREIKKKKWYQKLSDGIANATGAVTDKVSGIVRNFDTEELLNTYKREAATVTTAYFSIGEGLASNGESMLDTLAGIGSFIDSTVADALGFHDYADRLRNDTKAFVEKNYVADLYDDFFDNTSIGSWAKENSYGFATTRAIGNGIGYTVGVVITCYLTGGIAQSVNPQFVFAGKTVSRIMAFWGGFAGFGKGAQEAWSNGADYYSGVKYASLTAAWEAFQFWSGGEINSLSPFKNTFANVALRVGLDTLDGAAEGFAQPALQTVYRDGYYDPDTGEYIEFDDNATIVDKYAGMWKEQGGLKAVFTNAAIAGIMSIGGETGGLLFKKNKSVLELEKISQKLENSTGEIKGSDLIAIENARTKLGMSTDATVQEIVDEANRVYKNLDFDKIDVKNMDLATMKKFSDAVDGLDPKIQKDVLSAMMGVNELKNIKYTAEFDEAMDNFINSLTANEISTMDRSYKKVLNEYMSDYLKNNNLEIDDKEFDSILVEYKKLKSGNLEESILEQTDDIGKNIDANNDTNISTKIKEPEVYLTKDELIDSIRQTPYINRLDVDNQQRVIQEIMSNVEEACKLSGGTVDEVKLIRIGQDSCVLECNDKILKITGIFYDDNPLSEYVSNSDAIIKPIYEKTSSVEVDYIKRYFTVHLFDKLDTEGITQADVETMYIKLREDGYIWSDPRVENVARDQNGELKLIDYGQIIYVADKDPYFKRKEIEGNEVRYKEYAEAYKNYKNGVVE